MPSLSSWIALLGVLAFQVAALLVCTALAGKFTYEAKRKRAVWQAGFLAVGIFLLAEATGSSIKAGAPPSSEQSSNRFLRVTLLQSTALESVDAGVSRPNATASPMRWPGWVWVSGCAACVAFFAARTSWLSMQRRQMRPCRPGESLKVLLLKLGLTRVRLVIWDRVKGPVAFGILRPTVAIPSDFEERFTANQREVMLAHELAHLAQRDPAWFAFTNLLCSLLWWHPMIWWARKAFLNTCEASADQASTLLPEGPIHLAEALVALGRDLEVAHRNGLSVSGDGASTQLRSRVEALLVNSIEWSPLSKGWCWTPRLIGTSLVGLVLLAPWHGQTRPLATALANSLSLGTRSESPVSPKGSTQTSPQSANPSAPSLTPVDSETVLIRIEIVEVSDQLARQLEDLYSEQQRLDPAESPALPEEIISLTNLPSGHGVLAARSETQGQAVVIDTPHFEALRQKLRASSDVGWLTLGSGGADLRVGSGSTALAQVVNNRTVVCGVELSPGTDTNGVSVNYKTQEIQEGPEAQINTTLTEQGWQLDVSAKCLDFLGYEEREPLAVPGRQTVPSATPLYVELPLPHLRLRVARATINAAPGQTAVLRGPLRKPDPIKLRGSTHPTGPGASRFYIFITVLPDESAS